jgi:hypothetical protein
LQEKGGESIKPPLPIREEVSTEGVFAWAKELHGLRRTRFMGRWKVQIQLCLTTAVINTKRTIRALTKTEPVAGSQEVTNRAFITGMFADAVKEIACVMQRIFYAYRITSATVPADYIQSILGFLLTFI